MKGIPDDMYICWRKNFTEKQIEDALSRFVTLCLIPVLTQLALDPRKIAQHKFSRGELINLLVREIRAHQTQEEILRQELNKLKNSHLSIKNLVSAYMDKYKE